MTKQERKDSYKSYIKKIEEESQAIINELEYSLKTGEENKYLNRGIIEYINNLIKILIDLVYIIF